MVLFKLVLLLIIVLVSLGLWLGVVKILRNLVNAYIKSKLSSLLCVVFDFIILFFVLVLFFHNR